VQTQKPRLREKSGGTTAAKRDLREVDFDLRSVVEIIGENVERDVGDDFGNLGIGEAGGANGVKIGVAGAAVGGNQALGEAKGSRGFRVVFSVSKS
jgi:hypothetical protein